MEGNTFGGLLGTLQYVWGTKSTSVHNSSFFSSSGGLKASTLMTTITVSDNKELTCEIIFFIAIDAMLLRGKHNRMHQCSPVVWFGLKWMDVITTIQHVKTFCKLINPPEMQQSV